MAWNDSSRWRALASGAVVACTAGLLVTQASAGGAGDVRVGTDPLSKAEVGKALDALPRSRDTTKARSTGAMAGTQILTVQRQDRGKGREGDGRAAEVITYDYSTNSVTRRVIAVDTGKVLTAENATGVQPPLSSAEGDRALAIALGDTRFRTKLGDEFKRVTGRTLTDPAREVNVDPIVFVASAEPTKAVGAAAVCGAQRCAQLMLADSASMLLINLLPVVNLSQGTVLTTNAFLGD